MIYYMNTAHTPDNDVPLTTMPELSQEQIDELEYALCVYEMTAELAANAIADSSNAEG